MDPAETLRTGIGAYSVDFTPLSTDISTRPLAATSDTLGEFGLINNNALTVSTDGTDPSSILVFTFPADSLLFTDHAFTLVIY